jgi:hypothetical protein
VEYATMRSGLQPQDAESGASSFKTQFDAPAVWFEDQREFIRLYWSRELAAGKTKKEKLWKTGELKEATYEISTSE